MTAFVGIDLGTTNSAVCTFDGEALQVHRSPEQNLVTPSAIYFGPRGRHYGAAAYRHAAFDANRTATLFKRLIGTATPIHIADAGLTLSPEDCSAEILKVLFGYLPEEVRRLGTTGTVITVPAAFNQMQRDATLSAAEMAGIGKVSLMQEPVAAVMAVVRRRQADGTFLIYDLGGGTFDVAIAQCVAGRVTLLDHGGINMCGGRDIDRMLFDDVVVPWARSQFDLPESLNDWPEYTRFRSAALWAAERAKIELSSRTEAIISLSEHELRIKDRAGREIYVEVPLSRTALDLLLKPLIDSTVASAREVLASAHLSAADLDRVVFIGGPTQYKPLRDAVSGALSLPADSQSDPMTAVAEGAALFAESVDWSAEKRGRKATRESKQSVGPLRLEFAYVARTADHRSRVVVKAADLIPSGCEWQIDNLNTGWSSGRMPLSSGAAFDLQLSKDGENHFKIFVFHGAQGAILQTDAITITRTPVVVEGIPASHSVGVAVKERLSGNATKMRWLVRKGDALPRKGTETFRAGEALRANGPGALIFKLYEGEIEQPPEDNRLVGSFKIEGKDFTEGAIQAGDELLCEYEVADSGRLSMAVSVASVSGSFEPGHDFYSRQEGLVDYSNRSKCVADECCAVRQKTEGLSASVSDARLGEVITTLDRAETQAQNATDPESTKLASETVIEARRVLAQVRRDHMEAFRQTELDRELGWFADLREHAKTAELTSYDNLTRSARRALPQKTGEFDQLISEMRRIRSAVLWRQDWWVVSFFETLRDQAHRFDDPVLFRRLVHTGTEALKRDDMERLREVVSALWSKRLAVDPGDEPAEAVNIL